MSLSIAKTKYEHVVVDEKDVPIVAGTNMKIIELVLEKTAYGWSPEELHFQHPYLSLGQIYSALAYYWDHKEALDRDIEERLKLVNQIQKGTGRTPFKNRDVSSGEHRIRVEKDGYEIHQKQKKKKPSRWAECRLR